MFQLEQQIKLNKADEEFKNTAKKDKEKKLNEQLDELRDQLKQNRKLLDFEKEEKKDIQKSFNR